MILNLGCGTQAADDPEVTNIDWSIYLRIRRRRSLSWLGERVLGAARAQRLRSLPDNIVVHDLSKGIPVEDSSVDAVFHSHFFEHLDRQDAPAFLAEVHRVLRPGGVHRICVPDLHLLAQEYLQSFERSTESPLQAREHDGYVNALYEQSVRRMGAGTAEQRGVVRLIDRLVIGDARRRGETHQWMYDEVNLRVLLHDAGFVDIVRTRCNESAIPRWAEIGLETHGDGSEYKPGSLYVEAKRPS